MPLINPLRSFTVESTTVQGAAKDSGMLGWDLQLDTLSTTSGKTVPANYAVVSPVASEALGVVGAGYSIIQNEVLVDAMEGMSLHGSYRTGVLPGDRPVVAALMSSPRGVDIWVGLSTSHDGTERFRAHVWPCLGETILPGVAPTVWPRSREFATTENVKEWARWQTSVMAEAWRGWWDALGRRGAVTLFEARSESPSGMTVSDLPTDPRTFIRAVSRWWDHESPTRGEDGDARRVTFSVLQKRTEKERALRVLLSRVHT